MTSVVGLGALLVVLSSPNLQQAIINLWAVATNWVRIALVAMFLYPVLLIIVAHADAPRLTLFLTALIPGALLVAFLAIISPLWAAVVEHAPNSRIVRELRGEELARMLRHIQHHIFWVLAAEILFGVALTFAQSMGIEFNRDSSGGASIIFLLFLLFTAVVLAHWSNRTLPFARTMMIALVTIFLFGGFGEVKRKGQLLRSASARELLKGDGQSPIVRMFPSAGNREHVDTVVVKPESRTKYFKSDGESGFGWDYPDGSEKYLTVDMECSDGSKYVGKPINFDPNDPRRNPDLKPGEPYKFVLRARFTNRAKGMKFKVLLWRAPLAV